MTTLLQTTAGELRASDCGRYIYFDYTAPYKTDEEFVAGRLSEFFVTATYVTIYFAGEGPLSGRTVDVDTPIQVAVP